MPNYQVTVAVQPQYLPDRSAPEDQLFGFAYTITITNTGDIPAQLIARHWIIRDTQGRSEEVKGLGVVGQQPLLQPGESFRYTSGCQLRAASGTMHGSYFCVAEDAHRFEVPVPLFVLESDGTPGAGMDAGAPRVLH